MRKIFRARHAKPRRGAVPRVSDRRRGNPQPRPAPRRNDRVPDPVAAPDTASLPLPLGYCLGFGGL
jgi:hypothetical protein